MAVRSEAGYYCETHGLVPGQRTTHHASGTLAFLMTGGLSLFAPRRYHCPHCGQRVRRVGTKPTAQTEGFCIPCGQRTPNGAACRHCGRPLPSATEARRLTAVSGGQGPFAHA